MSSPSNGGTGGWKEVEFSTLFREPLRNGHSARESADGKGIRTLTLSAVTANDFSEKNTKITVATPQKAAGLWLEPGDVLIERSNTAELVGTAAVFRGPRNYAIFPDLLIRARLHGEVSDRYVEYFLASERARSHFRQAAQGIAGSMPKISQGVIERLRVPVPPRNVQDQIVAEIENHFTRLDAGIKSLERLQAHLRRYRAAVLKAACDGTLVPTESEMAAAERRQFEPAAALIERARRNVTVRGRGYEPLTAPRVLPKGWAWARASEFAEIQGGIQKQPTRAPKTNAFPFLRVANVLRGKLDLTEVHNIELFEGELERLRLQRGDLLIVEGNGSASEIGRMAMWDGSINDCVHQNHLIRLRPADGVLPGYIAAYWNSPEGAAGIAALASSTSGLFTLSVRKVGSLPVPLPPTAEQVRIVAEVERRLSVVEHVEASIGAQLRRAEGLRRSILARAFSGEASPPSPECAQPSDCGGSAS